MLMENPGSSSGQIVTPAAASPPTPPAPPTTPNPSVPPQSELPEPPPASVPTGLEQPEGSQRDTDSAEEITWTASEFVAHEKSAGWYLMLLGVSAFIAVVVYLISKDYVAVGVVVFGAIMLSIYAAHQPRQIEYKLDLSGLTIGQKHYKYSEFRSFAIVPEGAFSSIVFMPLKRFAPLTTIYFAPEDEERIGELLSTILPFDEEHAQDAVDRLMRRVRF